MSLNQELGADRLGIGIERVSPGLVLPLNVIGIRVSRRPNAAKISA